MAVARDVFRDDADYRDEIKRALKHTYPDNLLVAIFNIDPMQATSVLVHFPDDICDRLLVALESLDERRSKFLLEYYQEGKTLDVIASECGLTRERVRQLIRSGLNHLRSMQVARSLGYNYCNEARLAAYEEKLDALDQKLEELFVVRLTSDHQMDFNDDTPIDVLSLSHRSYNALRRGHIDTVGQLLSLVDNGALLTVKGLGVLCEEEIIKTIGFFDCFGGLKYSDCIMPVEERFAGLDVDGRSLIQNPYEKLLEKPSIKSVAMKQSKQKEPKVAKQSGLVKKKCGVLSDEEISRRVRAALNR